MGYTKIGPFVDGGAPYLSAATFNALEAGIMSGNAGVTVAAAATGVAATDTANLQNAISAAQAASQDLYIPGGATAYMCSSGLTWDIGGGSIIGIGLVDINFTALTSGRALTLTGPGTNHRAATSRISGLRLLGPDTDSTTIDGIYLNDGGGVDQFTVEHLIVTGFRDNITWGSNVWSTTFFKVYNTNAHRYGVNATSVTNAGEEMVFLGGTIAGAHNASGTGTAVYTPSSGADLKFIGVSLDYNDLEGDLNGGNITFAGTHIEDRNTGPMFKYSYTSSASPLVVDFTDCTWAPTESAAGGRDHIHEIKPSTGDRIQITFKGGGGGAYNVGTKWLVDNSGIVTLGHRVALSPAPAVDTGGTTYAFQWGEYFNLLPDLSSGGSFVTGGLSTGWTAGGTQTWSITTSGARTNYGIRAVGTGTTGTGTTYTTFPVSPGRAYQLSAYMNVTAYTAGSVQFSFQFYASDGTTAVLGGLRVGSSLSAVTSGQVGYARRINVPRGAQYVQVQLIAVNLNGTVTFSDMQLVPV